MGAGIGPVLRRRPGGHLEEHHRGAVAFGGGVVLASLTGAQERVQVRRCPGVEILGVDAGHREVEHHQMRVGTRVGLEDRQIRRLDVAVGDAVAFQGDQRGEQVGAPALQDVDGQPAAVVEFLGQGGAPGVLEQQRGAASDVNLVVQGHDPLVVLQPG